MQGCHNDLQGPGGGAETNRENKTQSDKIPKTFFYYYFFILKIKELLFYTYKHIE